jgi:hypothetical protein
MLKIPPEKEEDVARALQWAWLLALGGVVVLIAFVVLLFRLSPGPLGG